MGIVLLSFLFNAPFVFFVMTTTPHPPHSIEWFVDQIEQAIATHAQNTGLPAELYEPVAYALESGGKRIRPLLCLLTNNMLGGGTAACLPVAVAFEWFHNFTLLHDDVMDHAHIRRGKPSVMSQFGTNRAILSGDTMLIQAYQLLAQAPAPIHADLYELFNAMAIQVMEGQQWDMNFEETERVSVEDYLTMISGKTAALLAAATKGGAVVANAPQPIQEAVYLYAHHLGMAFQLQDDYLDLYGDIAIFGKQQGGDIAENKKTILYLTALQNAPNEVVTQLQDAYRMPNQFLEEKIEIISHLYRELDVPVRVQQQVAQYLDRADQALEPVAKEYNVQPLLAVSAKLRNRNV